MARPNLTEKEARRRAGRVGNVRYALRLDLNSDEYQGSVTVRFHMERPAAVHLDYQGREVRRIRVNGKALAPKVHKKNRIPLPAKLLRAGANQVKVDFASAYDNDGAGLHRCVDPVDGRSYLYTVFAPFDANRVLPCFDQPDLKAPLALTVRAPPEWIVASATPELTTHDEAGGRVHVFRPTPPLSTYLFNLVAGPWALWRDPKARIPSRLLAAQSMRQHVDADELFGLTRQGFDFYEGYFERDYPFEKYDQVFCPHFNWGAMENVGCVLHSDEMLFRHAPTRRERIDRADTVLHEMAHMWFGNLVTMEWWNDLWLNESFATYMANLALAEGTAWGDEAWEHFFLDIKTWALWQDSLATTHPIEMPVPDTETTFTNFDGITYGKGASVLKQLAHYLGDEPFRLGVAHYLERFAWSNATREDFLTCLGEAAGVDLHEWERRWLGTAGSNRLSVTMKADAGVVRRAWLQQDKGDGDRVRRPHVLEVVPYTKEKGRTGRLRRGEVLRATLAGAKVELPELEGQPVPRHLDVDVGDQAYARIHIEEAGLARELLRAEPNALGRARTWHSLWLAVRAAEVPPRDFVEVFLAEAGREDHAGVLAEALTGVRRCLGAYLDDRDRAAALPRLRKLCWRRAQRATDDGDLPSTWFDAWVGLLGGGAMVRRATGLLDRGEAPGGIDLDQERRWRLVEALAAAGADVGEILELERARDGTERGVQAAFRVEVARPDPASKAQAWERFVGDTESPLGLLRAGMKSFWHRGQREVLQPFVGCYARVLPELVNRPPFFLDAFVSSLFPSCFVETKTRDAMRRAQKALGPKAPGTITRALREELDELERALRIRAAAAR